MAYLQLWTLEQSILGCVNQTFQNMSLDKLLSWAHTKQPVEPIPSLVWRTELALICHGSTVAIDDANVRSVAKALGYYIKDLSVIQNGLQFGHPLRRKTNSPDSNERSKWSYKVSSSYFGLVWKWDAGSRLTRGLLYESVESGSYPVETYDVLMKIRRLACLRSSPLVLGLATLSARAEEMQQFLRTREIELSTAHLKTGRHGYTNHVRTLDIKDVDLATLSGDICGTAVDVSYVIARLKILTKLADFIIEECSINNDVACRALRETGLLRNLEASKLQIPALARRYKLKASCLLDDAISCQWRAEMIVQTVFTLATQRDQELSIEIARDSKTLAQQATRDSTSMKAIAAVTMFFLPGTFVASLFAMPIFTWDIESGQPISSKFWIYWVVTIPLTFTVVAIWLSWTNRGDIKHAIVAFRQRRRSQDIEKRRVPTRSRRGTVTIRNE